MLFGVVLGPPDTARPILNRMSHGELKALAHRMRGAGLPKHKTGRRRNTIDVTVMFAIAMYVIGGMSQTAASIEVATIRGLKDNPEKLRKQYRRWVGCPISPFP